MGPAEAVAVTTGKPCPHCARPTAVVGKSGQLARHHCTDSPATMTPAERVTNARRIEAARRATHLHRAQELDRVARQHRVTFWAAVLVEAVLWVGGVTTWAVGGHAAGWLLTAAAVAFVTWRRLLHLTGVTDEARALVAQSAAEHEKAHRVLLDVEGAVPGHVAWPGLLTDLDNLTED